MLVSGLSKGWEMICWQQAQNPLDKQQAQRDSIPPSLYSQLSWQGDEGPSRSDLC